MIPGIPYFHIVLTLPHKLNELVSINDKLLLDTLFQTSAESVIHMCNDPEILGAKPGILSVCHTWNSSLLQHYHVHMIVTGGGLDKDNNFVNLIELRKAQEKARSEAAQATQTARSEEEAVPDNNDENSTDNADSEKTYDYFMPLKALTCLFRGKFMAATRELYNKHKLKLPESLSHLEDPYEWTSFCHKLETMDWIGFLGEAFDMETNEFERIGNYVTRPCMDNSRIIGHGTEENTNTHDVIRYLSTFISASGITEDRIVLHEDNQVTFLAREADGKGYHKRVTLSDHEFIERFLQHVLPKGFGRVRSYGIFANSRRHKSLNIIFQQLKKVQFKYSAIKEAKSIDLLRLLFPNKKWGICPVCQGGLKSVPFGNAQPWLPRGRPA